MDENTRLKYWKQFVTDPILWKYKACDLAHAAEMLHERETQAIDTLTREQPASGSLEANRLIADTSLFPIAYMLAGFAIENAMKGVLIDKLGIDDPSDPRVIKITKEHDLIKLAQDTLPELIEPNKSLLEKLHQYVTWLGRYPRPRTPHNYMKEDPESGVLEMFPVSQNDWSGYVNLLSVLLLKLCERTKDESKVPGTTVPRQF
jgi:hypothetical protein